LYSLVEEVPLEEVLRGGGGGDRGERGEQTPVPRDTPETARRAGQTDVSAQIVALGASRAEGGGVAVDAPGRTRQTVSVVGRRDDCEVVGGDALVAVGAEGVVISRLGVLGERLEVSTEMGDVPAVLTLGTDVASAEKTGSAVILIGARADRTTRRALLAPPSLSVLHEIVSVIAG